MSLKRLAVTVCGAGLLLGSGCSSNGHDGGGGGGAGANDAGGGPANDSGIASTPPGNGVEAGSTEGGGVPISSRAYPLITPQVEAAAPAALGGRGRMRKVGAREPHAMDLSVSDIAQRFFGAGPTDIYFILQNIDAMITGLNGGSDVSPCLSQAPVAYTLQPFGESVAMYGQCYRQTGSSLLQWGVKDGTFYLWNVGGVELTAIIATPLTPGASGNADGGAAGADTADADTSEAGDDGGSAAGGAVAQYAVHAWIGVGADNGAGGCGTAWDDCSYGAIELTANPGTASFEMAVAGVGFGYCGAQLVSDGTDVFVTGSTDMGSACNDSATLCVAAGDGSAATCTPAEQGFAIAPMGREATSGPATLATGGDASAQVFAASAYPGGSGNTIVLDGTSSDSVHIDSASTTPSKGLGQYP